ncbi:hypothetical protein FO516_30290, partial [Priestia megaterium]
RGTRSLARNSTAVSQGVQLMSHICSSLIESMQLCLNLFLFVKKRSAFFTSLHTIVIIRRESYGKKSSYFIAFIMRSDALLCNAALSVNNFEFARDF